MKGCDIMFRATDLARYIIAYENQLSRQIDITNLRLQKTLYYIQGIKPWKLNKGSNREA